MSAQKYLTTQPMRELEYYHPEERYKEKGYPYRGAARRHPYDPGKLLLIPSPEEAPHSFYEFKSSDILHAELLRSITTEGGQTLQIHEVWVRRGSPAIIMHPFTVGEDEAE